MNHMELFDELTYIDDDLILEAHEVPASRRSYDRFGGLRRAAAVLAAMMVLVVTVVATGGDLPAVSEKLLGDSIHSVDIAWHSGESRVYQEESGAIEVDGSEYGYLIYTTYGASRGVASMKLESGETLEVVFEAGLVMPDGTLQYKTVSKQGVDRVAVFMTNQLGGSYGSITSIRVFFYRITETGERVLVGHWNNSLRGWGAITGVEDAYPLWPEETAEAQTVHPEGSDVVVVIEDPDE